MNHGRPTVVPEILAHVYNWSVPLERQALRIALDMAVVRPGERVLDVATGTGAVLRELALCDTFARQVIGIDRSRSMLSAGRRRASSASLLIADARALPFPAASFDVISVCYLVHLLKPDERRRVFDAVRGVVRPGGRVVCVTVDADQPILRRVLGALPAWTGLRRLDPRPDMQIAGLRPIRAQYAGAGWPSLCVLAEPG